MFMDLKEKVINETIMVLSTRYSSEDLRFIQNIMSCCFQEFDVIQKKDLPSTEIIDNNYILRH